MTYIKEFFDFSQLLMNKEMVIINNDQTKCFEKNVKIYLKININLRRLKDLLATLSLV